MKRRPYAVSRSGCSGVRIRQKIAEFQKAVAGAEPLIETSAIEHTAEVLQVDETYRSGGPEDWAWAPGRSDQQGIAPPKTVACARAQLAVPAV